MLETSTLPSLFRWAFAGLVVAGCAASPPPAVTAAPGPVVAAPDPAIEQATQKAKLAEEARALLAQAETDVQRARAKRALWLKAWEDLLASRQAAAAGESAKAIGHARRASELAQLGLEQLAYPAVK
jgi:uncharacterized protein (DUF1697 family)